MFELMRLELQHYDYLFSRSLYRRNFWVFGII